MKLFYRILLLSTLLFSVSFSCSTRKKEIAEQNNKMVKIHTKITKIVSESEKLKKEPDKYIKHCEKIINTAKTQKKKLADLKVRDELSKLKKTLEQTLVELIEGYDKVVKLYESSKKLEAQKAVKTVEKNFEEKTATLRTLSRKIAKEIDIKIKEKNPKAAGKKKTKSKKTENTQSEKKSEKKQENKPVSPANKTPESATKDLPGKQPAKNKTP